MFSGISSSPPLWCHPAPSQMSAPTAPGAMWALISARCRLMHSVLAVGEMIAAPMPRAGQIAPRM
jgi:hypothetical protein